MPTFNDDNGFKQRVREIAIQLGDLASDGPPFTADAIVGVTVEFVKDGDLHKVLFPAAQSVSAR